MGKLNNRLAALVPPLCAISIFFSTVSYCYFRLPDEKEVNEIREFVNEVEKREGKCSAYLTSIKISDIVYGRNDTGNIQTWYSQLKAEVLPKVIEEIKEAKEREEVIWHLSFFDYLKTCLTAKNWTAPYRPFLN